MRGLPPKEELGDGDMGWRGVNMRLHASQVPAGYASSAVNMRFTDQTPETRGGKCPVVWLNKVVSGKANPWGTVYGQGNFLDPVSKVKFSLMAADGKVYFSRANNATVELTLPAGVTITGPVKFYQCFSVVVMAREDSTGTPMEALVMGSLADGFTTVTVSAAVAGTIQGTLTIPAFFQGVAYGNRLFLLDGDSLKFSDFQDYTRYTLKQDLRVNQGEADAAVAVAPFGKTTLIVFKETRIYRVNNVSGDLSGASLDPSPVTKRYGCVAPESVVDAGNDLLWLSQQGVASLGLTVQGEIQAAQGAGEDKAPMFSADIEPLIKRINWNYAKDAVGIIHDERYYLAVPLDDGVSLRTELVPVGSPYRSPGFVYVTVEVGKMYRWTPGTNEDSMTCGSDTLVGAGDFTAKDVNLTVWSRLPLATFPTVTGSIREVYKGVNNAVLVYSFTNKAWEGYDQSSGLEVKRFFTFPYNGKERLFFVGADGWVNLYDEGFEDQLAMPYVDVEVSSLPAVGNTVQVNGGTVVAAANSAVNLGATGWGSQTLALAQVNLWTDSTFNSGYSPAAPVVWTAPSCVVNQIANGVRFYGLNGVVPVVVTTGTWATVTYHTHQGIETELLTRGYKGGQGLARKQGRELVVLGETWAPELDVSVVTEGVNEEVEAVTGLTRDRTKFERPWDAAPFKEDNSDHNFERAGREDYSVALGATGIDLDAGIGLDYHQNLRLRVHVSARARAAQVKVVNREGRVRVLGIGYSGFEVEKGRKGTGI